MNKDIQSQAQKLNVKHRKRRIWHRILSIPICIVVFITTYAMILPAITLDTSPDTYCGLEEHVHTDACYEVPGVAEHTEIQCPVEASLHTHTDACYNGGNIPVCGQVDYIIHTHTNICFNDSGDLICTLPEQGEHTHTDACYDANGKLICGMTNGVEHTHTEDCLVTVPATAPQGLICTKTEHTHTEECFDPKAGSGNSIMAVSETQPDAKTDGSTSDAVKEQTSYTRTYQNDDGEEVTVTGTASSDKATSQIESEFAGTDNAGSSDNDGKVLTDKSVIYGKDDYGAFSSYADNTFSVTLSALGQQYENTKSTTLKTPLDVVFVLDTSGSMVADGVTRGEDGVETLNELAKYVMELNAYNRFGVATFSSNSRHTYNNGFDAHELLPINSYANAKDNDILTYTAGTSDASYYNSTVSVNTAVSGTSSTNSTYFYGGTYTTAGYYQAAQMLTGTTGRTVTVDGVEMERVPIIIFITDGATTFSSGGTNKYEYSSSQDGTGNSTSNNNLFYTILSAYHYKEQVSDAYFDNAKMYTIGIGVDPSETADITVKTILDPTDANIAALGSTYNTAKNNLTNKTNFPRNYTSQHGTEFYFCDGTFTAQNFNSDLTNRIKQFIRINMGEFVYSSSQHTTTDITMTDEIGSGMEVKTDQGLVLRYDGTNYPLSLVKTKKGVRTYRYNGDTKVKANQYGEEVALSGITVTIDTTSDGNQRVTWNIPADLLPEYTHARTDIWYYQMLPVRLLYQVGLTEASQEAVEAMDEDSDNLIFYTNAYDDDNATTILSPNEGTDETSKNSYYYAEDYAGESFDKEENTTYTRPTYREVSALDSDNKITFTMGNNGKLVFSSAAKTPDTSSEKTSITVNKVWKDKDGNIITDTSSLKLPYVTASVKADGKTYASHVLNKLNNWQYTFTDLPTKNQDGSDIVWTVDEDSVPTGYEKESVELTGQTDGASTVTALEDGGIYIFRNSSNYAISNASGSTVSGAIGENTDTTIQWKAIAQSDGSFKLQNVSSGNYLAGYRYRDWSNTYYVTADSGNTSGYSYSWTVRNGYLSTTVGNRTEYISLSGSSISLQDWYYYATSFTITKKGIPSYTFTITNKAKSSALLTITKTVEATDTSGTFNFEVSWEGGTPISFSLRNTETYTLEIPIGVEITVKELNSDGYVVSFIKGDNKQSGLSTYTLTANEDTSLTVQNTASVELPETGGIGSYYYTFGALGIVLIAIVTGSLLLRRRYRKGGNE